MAIASFHLEEGCLAALAHGVDSELVEAAGRGDGRVVVHPLAAVHGPVVVAVVVDVAVSVKHQSVFTNLLGQSALRRRSHDNNTCRLESRLGTFRNQSIFCFEAFSHNSRLAIWIQSYH